MSRLLATALLTLVGASVVAFGVMHVAPMDPARYMLGFRQGVRQEQIHQISQWYGLDRPKAVQYLRWMGRVLRGDFGSSITTRREVAPEIARRLPWSLVLIAVSGLLAWGIALPLAVASSGGRAARLAGGAVAGFSFLTPTFLLAALGVYLFAVRLVWIPILPPFEFNLLDWRLWRGMVLPGLSVALPVAAVLVREMRGPLGEALRAPYTTAARAKGVAERRVVWGHAARVAARAATARPLWLISALISGLLVAEEIFNWPGVARVLMRGIVQRDLPVMQASLLVLAAVVLAAEFAVRALPRFPEAVEDAAAADRARGRPLRGPGLRMRVAAAVVLALAVGALAAPLLVRFPPDQVHLDEIHAPPSLRHWMGTDSSGRDLFSRLLHAGRTSLVLAVGASVAAVAGALLLTAPLRVPRRRVRRWGLGWVDTVDWAGRAITAVPALPLAMSVIAIGGRSPALIGAAFAAMGLAAVLGRARALQADAWGWPFVEAAAAAGASPVRILERHLLPHLARPLLAAVAGLVPAFIMLEATLGFLGFSVTPTTATWGTLLWRGREALHRGDWWLLAFPWLFLAVAAWAFAAVAEGLSAPEPPTYIRTVRRAPGREWGLAAAGAPRRTAARPRPPLPRPVPAPAGPTTAVGGGSAGIGDPAGGSDGGGAGAC